MTLGALKLVPVPVDAVIDPTPDNRKLTGRSAVTLIELPSYTTGALGVIVIDCAQAITGKKSKIALISIDTISSAE